MRHRVTVALSLWSVFFYFVFTSKSTVLTRSGSGALKNSQQNPPREQVSHGFNLTTSHRSLEDWRTACCAHPRRQKRQKVSFSGERHKLTVRRHTVSSTAQQTLRRHKTVRAPRKQCERSGFYAQFTTVQRTSTGRFVYFTECVI